MGTNKITLPLERRKRAVAPARRRDNCRHFLDFETNDGFPDSAAMRFDNGAVVRVAQTGIQSIASRPGTIGAVPEPSTWAMMLLGFGGVGVALRRRRRATFIAQLA